MTIHQTITANGNYTHDGTNAPTKRWRGGSGSFFAAGTFASATATLQWSIDGTTWVNHTTGLSAAGAQHFTYGAGVFLRVAVASATGSTDFVILVSEVGYGRG